MMAGSSSNIKEEIEMSVIKELVPETQGQDSERLKIAEFSEHGSWSLGAPRQQQKLYSKAAGSAAGQPVGNTSDNQPKKEEAKPSTPKTSKEQDRGDAPPQECPRDFPAIGFRYENSPGADIIAEIGLEELNELEMEVMRSQLRMISGRLCALEDQSAAACQREILIFTMLLSACVVNLWLWMRQ